MKLIDTHCHIDVAAFDPDRAAVLEHCRLLGITALVVPAIDREHWDRLLELCKTHQGLYPALGLHPMFLHQHETSHIDDLKHYAERYPLVAIGEIGLDFYQKDFDAKQQLHYFETQLTVADQVGLPVLLHVRKAHDETIKLLKRIHRHGGIVHAFNGSIQQAGQYVSMGFKLGFGGMLTYERSNKLRQLAKQLPLDAIVLETDAPDMVVARHRGERNSPEYLIDSLNTLAELRQLPIEEVAKQTTLNAKSVLREIA